MLPEVDAVVVVPEVELVVEPEVELEPVAEPEPLVEVEPVELFTVAAPITITAVGVAAVDKTVVDDKEPETGVEALEVVELVVLETGALL